MFYFIRNLQYKWFNCNALVVIKFSFYLSFKVFTLQMIKYDVRLLF